MSTSNDHTVDESVNAMDREIQWINEFMSNSVSSEIQVLMDKVLGASATVSEMLDVRHLIEMIGVKNLSEDLKKFECLYGHSANAGEIKKFVLDMFRN